MALRSFVTIDSKDLIVTFSSSAGLVGNSIIITSDIPDGTVFTYTSTSGRWLTRDDTGTNVDIIADGDTSGHVINDGARRINDGNGVEAGSLIKVRALDEVGIPTGPAITITLFSQSLIRN